MNQRRTEFALMTVAFIVFVFVAWRLGQNQGYSDGQWKGRIEGLDRAAFINVHSPNPCNLQAAANTYFWYDSIFCERLRQWSERSGPDTIMALENLSKRYGTNNPRMGGDD